MNGWAMTQSDQNHRHDHGKHKHRRKRRERIRFFGHSFPLFSLHLFDDADVVVEPLTLIHAVLLDVDTD